MTIYQHFRKEEEPFIDQVLSWKDQVERNYQPKLTDFLDPREQQIVLQIIGSNHSEIVLSFDGGGEFSERKRAIIAPYYENITKESFQLSLLEANFQEKFITITHRDVMGAFLNAGIKRKKLGDIYVSNGTIQIVTTNDIESFIRMNLTSIKNASVQFREKEFSHLIEEKQQWIESMQTVSSLRLDTVLKEIYRLSRTDAQTLIRNKLVKVNFRVVEDAKFQLQQGDLLSVRGKGRSKIVAIHGLTKKEKWRITTALLK